MKKDFQTTVCDQCVYIRHTDHDLLITLVHNDMAIFGSNQECCCQNEGGIGKPLHNQGPWRGEVSVYRSGSLTRKKTRTELDQTEKSYLEPESAQN